MFSVNARQNLLGKYLAETSPMSFTCGDFLVERLHDWGVRRICGYPGDGINGKSWHFLKERTR
jgi:hypothetical protein